MDEWGQQVRLQKEVLVRGLNVVPCCNPPATVGEPLLLVEGVQVLDQRVAEYQVERVVLEREVARIANDLSEVVAVLLVRQEVQENHLGPDGQHHPNVVGSPDVKDPRAGVDSKRLGKAMHSPRPELAVQLGGKIMNIHDQKRSDRDPYDSMGSSMGCLPCSRCTGVEGWIILERALGRSTTGSVARRLPDHDLPLQGRLVGQPTVQALLGEHAQLDLGHI